MRLTAKELKQVKALLEESDPYETVEYTNKLFAILDIENRFGFTDGWWEQETLGWEGLHLPRIFERRLRNKWK